MNIVPYTDDFKIQLISVWEKSVRATHHFLKIEDIDYYKIIVSRIDFNLFKVQCAVTDDQKLTGFIGISENKIEMLFLDPTYIGKGIGKSLLNFGIHQLKATEVDVNEQNVNAVQFYNKFGFVSYERTPTDSEGKNYPILKMRLA
jgi:putative acetyltransferase